MKNAIVTALVIIVVVLSASISCCDAQKDISALTAAAPRGEPAPGKEPTKQEMSERIGDNLANLDEIIGFIPGLKKEAGPEGKNVSYSYNGKKIEDLDKEELSKLYGRVNSEAVRVRTDRINRQLAQIKRIEQLSRQNNRVARVPRVPARPPKIPAPPPRLPARLPKT